MNYHGHYDGESFDAIDSLDIALHCWVSLDRGMGLRMMMEYLLACVCLA